MSRAAAEVGGGARFQLAAMSHLASGEFHLLLTPRSAFIQVVFIQGEASEPLQKHLAIWWANPSQRLSFSHLAINTQHLWPFHQSRAAANHNAKRLAGALLGLVQAARGDRPAKRRDACARTERAAASCMLLQRTYKWWRVGCGAPPIGGLGGAPPPFQVCVCVCRWWKGGGGSEPTMGDGRPNAWGWVGRLAQIVGVCVCAANAAGFKKGGGGRDHTVGPIVGRGVAWRPVAQGRFRGTGATENSLCCCLVRVFCVCLCRWGLDVEWGDGKGGVSQEEIKEGGSLRAGRRQA